MEQELNLNCFDCNKSLQYCTCMEDTIDMTDPLEEAAKEYAEMHLDVSGNLGKYLVKAVFQDGALWQQERMYSEEEMLQALNIGFTSTDETWEECVEFTKEQFKKK